MNANEAIWTGNVSLCRFLPSLRSYLDMAKVLVFRYMFWFVLAVVFVTGSTRISVFGLGYLLACFFFLLYGRRLMIKPSRTRLLMWDCLIMYNVGVIISKNALSVSELHSTTGAKACRLYKGYNNLWYVYIHLCMCGPDRSWPVCLWLRCRHVSVGWSSSSVSSVQSKATTTVSLFSQQNVGL